MRIDIIADIACPWCFVGKRRLERAIALRPHTTVSLAWRAFQLNPELPSEGIAQETYFKTKFGASRNPERIYANVIAAGRGEGIDFAFDRISRMPNTLGAHRLVRHATRAGCASEVADLMFQGFFLDGRDIGDIDVLVEIAATVGLDRKEARAALSGHDGDAAIRAEDRQARRLGINAIPCFIFDSGYAISGAQEPEMFLPLFDLVAETARSSEQACGGETGPRFPV
jgi:predicted DsbA family dithiol-disulfide isomerase